MMTSLRLWLRRTRLVWVVFLVPTALVMLRQGAWESDWVWMLSRVNSIPMLLSPVAAAVAALLVVRDWNRAIRAELPMRLAGRGLVHLGVTVLIRAWALVLLAGLIGSLACWRHHASGGVIAVPGQLFLGLVALIPAVVLGLLGGVLVESPLTAPVLLIAVFVSHQALWSVAGPQFLSPDMPVLIMRKWRLAQTRLYWELVGNLALALTCGALVALRCARTVRGRVQAGIAVAVGLAGVIACIVAVAQHPAYYVELPR